MTNSRGRTGLAPLGIVLLALLTISIALGAWITISGFNSQAREQAQVEAEAAKKRTTLGIAIEAIDSNLLSIRNSGKGRISEVSVYIDGVPANLVENFRGLGENERTVLELEVAPTFGEHRLRVVANSVAQDEIRISGRSLAIFKARIPIRVTNAGNRDYKSTWAFGGSADGGKEISVSLPISDGGSVVATAEGLEYPSKIVTNWYNSAWKNRREINFSDFAGHGYSGNVVEVLLEKLKLSTGRCEELRITSEEGRLVPYEVLVQDGASCKIRLPIKVAPGTVGRYYAYSSNPLGGALEGEVEISVPNYTKDLCIDNGKLVACFGLSQGGIMNLSEKGGANLLTWNVGPDGKYSGVAPSVLYKEGWDYSKSACSDGYKYINHTLRKGKISLRLDYYFGISCSGANYTYRYLGTFYPDTNFFDIETSNLNEVRFGGTLQNFFSQPNWNRSFPSEGSVVSDGKYSAYWRVNSPESTAIGTVALFLNERAIGGFIRPPNFIVLDDSQSLPPGVISVMRTVVSKSEYKEAPTKGEYEKTLPGALGVSIGEDESASANPSAKVDFSVFLDRGASKSVYLYYTDSEIAATRRKPAHKNALVGYGLEGTVGKEEILNAKPSSGTAGNSSTSQG